MCVTNTTYRRAQPIALPQQQAGCPSGLTQRLMGTFQLAVPVKPDTSVPFAAPVQTQQPSYVAPVAEKQRPKRRRKPQKPGKTAKMNDRHFVVHNYHDHALDSEEDVEDLEHNEESRRKGGVAVAFPIKLHAILDQVARDGYAHVISWQPHGRCFVIHQPKEFVNSVMPKYFRQTKLTSFQRQLNLYGFCRLTRGPDAGGYYHELFLRGKVFLCKRMVRTKVKGTKFKAASSPDQEPDFYSMPAVVVTPHHSPLGSPQHKSQSYDELAVEPEYSNTLMQNGNPVVPNAGLEGLYNAIHQQQIQPSFDSFRFSQVPSLVPQLHLPVTVQARPQEPTRSCNFFQSGQADQVLDEAVNELFLDPNSSDMAADMNELDEFVRDWEPSNFSQTLDNDLALGFMLDKLMED